MTPIDLTTRTAGAKIGGFGLFGAANMAIVPGHGPVPKRGSSPRGLGRWRVRLRHRPLLRLNGRDEVEQSDCRDGRTADDRGYLLVASDGGVFSFGDAKFYGSLGSRHLNRPIVGIAVDRGRRLLVARRRWRHLRVRQGALPRLSRHLSRPELPCPRSRTPTARATRFCSRTG